jgi:hypothetical protein
VAGVSLDRALGRLQPDAFTEQILRDVLVLFVRHPGEPLTERDVARRIGRDTDELGLVLPVLASGFVLDFDRESEVYRYTGDVVLGYEIDAFRRRIDSRQSHITSNVARFREHHGP